MVRTIPIIVLLLCAGPAAAHAEGAEPAPAPETAAAPSVPLTPKSVATDQNKDGKPDQWEHYENGVIARLETDTNYDGKVDEVAYFEEKRLVRGEKDIDHDGKMDQWFTY
ncbi:MAG: hypothetical protein MOGMAGMI_00546 [Candidatus Omnitrophica bacterium]|nr:hypothetical protein [Candidatus Omnitrophota bacterium]